MLITFNIKNRQKQEMAMVFEYVKISKAAADLF